MTLLKWKNHLIEDVEVNLMLSALKERYGYDFSGYARASLKRRLSELSRYFEVKHLSELLPVMLYNEAVAQTVINNITVPTSAFFRNPEVWKKVREIALPQLNSFPWINIWQVGCGHGEETYTLAILLHEAGLLKKSRIFTSDINPDFLQDARHGSWSRRRLQSWRENYVNAGGSTNFDSYFVSKGEQVMIRQELKQSIEFIQHNLVVEDVFKEVQLVVCRNVLIYFDDKLLERVLHLLSRSLERGGLLLLGHSEKIMELDDKYHELQELNESVNLYRKRIVRKRHV